MSDDVAGVTTEGVYSGEWQRCQVWAHVTAAACVTDSGGDDHAQSGNAGSGAAVFPRVTRVCVPGCWLS